MFNNHNHNHSNFFQGCKTLEDLKKRYRQLSKDNHPDKGGSTEKMQEINNAYEASWTNWKDSASSSDNSFERSWAEKSTWAGEEDFMAAVNAVANLNLDVEVCGIYVWVSGDTRPAKDTLKQAGYRWHSKKIKWYWKPANYYSRSRGSWSMKKIRDAFGSEEVSSRKSQTKIA